jgi:PAS domain S-box-containing protein
MRLRTKLLLILSIVGTAAALAGSTVVYLKACEKLEQAAEVRLQKAADLLAESVQRRFDAELRKFEHWADMPLVVQTALHPDNPELTAAFERYFSSVVAREPYSSVYLITPEGDLVACDDPRRLHIPYAKVVIKFASAQAGLAGEPNIGLTVFSRVSARPVIPLTAPVRHEGRVLLILRAGIDMGRLTKELLDPLNRDRAERAYLFEPSLPRSLPKGHVPMYPVDFPAYSYPSEALEAAFEHSPTAVFRYRDRLGEHLVAASRMQNPAWVVLMLQPMSEILAPINSLRQTMVLVVVLALAFFIGSVLLLNAPVTLGIERCRKFAMDIGSGKLDRRLHLRSSDEVGQLAHALNDMAAQLQSQHDSLEKAERKYREIYENAVEGIFQADEAGALSAANPRLVALLGTTSPNDLIGRELPHLYTEPSRWRELIDRLRSEGEVADFHSEILRLDGTRRQVLVQARAEVDAAGKIRVINGALEDVTELLEAEAMAERARETEELLLRTELEMLRYQIDPHFLLNALNSIRELVLSAPREGTRMIESLAEYFHAGLINRSGQLSTMGDELSHVRHYLQIEQIRYGGQLRVEIEAGDGIEPVPAPAYILLPLVENGVKYGRRSGANPLCIRIHVFPDGPDCVAEIANTGHWLEPGSQNGSSGTRLGLENVRRRLAYCYGQDAGLTIEEEDGWVAIRVRFPVQCPIERKIGGAPS